MILGDWHAEFKAEYHKEELCQVLKNFTGILNAKDEENLYPV